MADLIYETDTWRITTDDLIAPIKEQYSVRKFLPVDVILQEKDKQIKYYQWKEDYRSAYQWDPVRHPNTSYAIEPLTKNVPLIDTGMALNRSERERSEVSKFDLQARLAALAPNVVIDENRFAIAGEPSIGVTSFANTTDNSTAATTELNVTTEALMKSTLVAQIVQLGTAMGGIETLKNVPLMLGMSSDVYNKAIQTGITGYVSADRPDNVMTAIEAVLAKYGGPGSGIWASNFLGGTVTRASDDQWGLTPGTTNSTLYPWNKNVISIPASPFRSLKKENEIDGIEWEFTERWIAHFKQPALVLYGGTAIIA